MVHQYKNNGYNIVLDVNSGAVHVVDDVVYDVLALYETCSKQEIADRLNFANQSFFGKYFKHYTGMSPKEYRKSR